MNNIRLTPKGQRKLRAVREAQLMIAAGFIFACFTKAPVELFIAFAVAVGGNALSFMWGNVKAHQAHAEMDRGLLP
jgi:hypothetical protein